jgi:hypothetical protein
VDHPAGAIVPGHKYVGVGTPSALRGCGSDDTPVATGGETPYVEGGDGIVALRDSFDRLAATRPPGTGAFGAPTLVI